MKKHRKKPVIVEERPWKYTPLLPDRMFNREFRGQGDLRPEQREAWLLMREQMWAVREGLA